jgi:hypothetical protein
MNSYKLSDMIKGWFIGDFNPSLFKTQDFEVGVKEYSSGEFEAAHYHKIATEFTVIIEGMVEMNGKIFSTGDIIKILPNEVTNFKAISDTKTVVVKIPGALNDKYTDL